MSTKKKWKNLYTRGLSCWRVQCPICKKVFMMPRIQGWKPWKGCPMCWVELDFEDPFKKEKKS